MFLVKHTITTSLVLLFLLTANAVSAQNGDPIAGREKSLLCQGCHGEFGISTESLIPKLAGQYQAYIEKQVRDYQSGIRSHQIMNAMAATVSDEDLADVAAYFTYQTRMAGDGRDRNKLGMQLFRFGEPTRKILACINCHGVKGKGLDPNISMFPVIGGQHKEYIQKQLIEFREGFRTNSQNGIMNKVAAQMSDSDIEAVSEYISAQ